jgi:hypothetical protein
MSTKLYYPLTVKIVFPEYWEIVLRFQQYECLLFILYRLALIKEKLKQGGWKNEQAKSGNNDKR